MGTGYSINSEPVTLPMDTDTGCNRGDLFARDMYVYFRGVELLTKRIVSSDIAQDLFPCDLHPDDWYAQPWETGEHPYDEFRIELFNHLVHATGNRNDAYFDSREIVRNDVYSGGRAHLARLLRFKELPDELNHFQYYVGNRSRLQLFYGLDDLDIAKVFDAMPKYAEALCIDLAKSADENVTATNTDWLDEYRCVALALYHCMPNPARRMVKRFCDTHFIDFIVNSRSPAIMYHKEEMYYE